MMKYALLLALLAAPYIAFGAGFAKQSLFLSRSAVVEGETVIIHAVIANEDASAFTGTMQFSEGAAAIGSVPVSLNANEASVVSVSWKPLKGSHTVVAELKKGTEVVERQSETFSIAAKPQPADTVAQAAAPVESSQKIQDSIAGFSPAAANATAPVFKFIDSGRATLSDTIDGQIAAAKVNLGDRSGEVLGAGTVAQATTDPTGTFWFILWTLYLYLLTLLNFIIGSAGIFYPVAALLVLYFLWRLFNRYRRPAY